MGRKKKSGTWTRIVPVTVKRKDAQVLVFISDIEKQEVRIQSLFNEWFLLATATFDSRQSAEEFVENFSPEHATQFVIRNLKEVGGK